MTDNQRFSDFGAGWRCRQGRNAEEFDLKIAGYEEITFKMKPGDSVETRPTKENIIEITRKDGSIETIKLTREVANKKPIGIFFGDCPVSTIVSYLREQKSSSIKLIGSNRYLHGETYNGQKFFCFKMLIEHDLDKIRGIEFSDIIEIFEPDQKLMEFVRTRLRG